MTNVLPPPSEPERESHPDVEAHLTVSGWLALQWIVVRCRLRTVAQSSRILPARSSATLVPGELMVAAPIAAPIDAVLRKVSDHFKQLTHLRSEFVRDASPDTDRGEGTPPLVPLGYRYARVDCRVGVERYLSDAIRVVSRHQRRGRFDAYAVQSMRLVQNAPPAPSGPIVFDPSFLAEVARLRTGSFQGNGVHVRIVDRMLPAQTCYPPVVVPDGHGTLMYEIVHTVAPLASLDAVAVGDQYEASSWSLLERVTAHRDVDVMVVSMSLDLGGSGKNADDRRAFMARWLTDVTRSPLRPMVVFPTGNVRDGEPINEIAIPGRFEAAVTIGAINPDDRRASGSRYGSKDGPEKYEWWVAPGGDFDVRGVRFACATMGGSPQAGTSVANAVAGGMIACLIQELRDARVTAAAPADEVEVLTRLVDAMPVGSSQRAELERILRDTSLAARGEVTRWNVLAGLRDRCQPVAGQSQLHVGLGHLRI